MVGIDWAREYVANMTIYRCRGFIMTEEEYLLYSKCLKTLSLVEDLTQFNLKMELKNAKKIDKDSRQQGFEGD